MSSTTIKATKAQAATLTFAFKNPDGTDYSLAGCTVELTVRREVADDPIIDKLATLSGNVATVALTETDTDQDIRVYPSLLELTDAQSHTAPSRRFYLYITSAQTSDWTGSITVGSEDVDVAITVSAPTNEVDKYFRMDFGVSTSVTVNHNLSKRPAVTVVDSAGDEVVVDVQHVNDNQLILSIVGGFSGSVFCN